MKKLLLLATLIGGIFVSAEAKELKFLYEDKPVTEGATVQYTGQLVMGAPVVDGYVNGYVMIVIDPEIHLISDVAAPVTVRAYSKTGAGIQLCAGGDCVPGTDIIKKGVAMKANDALNLQMDANLQFVNEEVVIPYYDVLLEAWYDDDPGNKISMTVQMGDLSAGVEGIAAGGSAVNVNGKNLTYDLPGVSEISVYSLSGKRVLGKSVSGSGSISLDNLTSGIYLYRVSGKEGKAGKFVIR